MTAKKTLQNKRVLFIDDDQNICLQFSDCFRNKVGAITTIATAEQALDHLQTEIYDIILCDYRLPGMNGLVFFQELNRLGLPVFKVIITGYGDLQLAVIALRIGVDDFILKPFDARKVEQSLIRLLDKTPRQSPKPPEDDKSLDELWQYQNARYESVLRKTVHKMNNVLQSIAGNVEMGLIEVGDSSKVTKRFNDIIRGIEEMLKLIKDISH